MKKKLFAILVIIVAAFAIFAVLAQHTAPTPPPAPKNAAVLDEVAAQIGSSMQDLLAKDNLKAAQERPYLAADAASAAAEIAGEPISAAYFNYRCKLYTTASGDDPADAAWQSIKKEVVKFQFAAEHKLLPGDKEVEYAARQEREIIESDEDARQQVEYLFAQCGLTWDEYWQLFKPTYETRTALVKQNVAAYLQENNLGDLDYDSVTINILNS